MLAYAIYARKSSESIDRQILSIESQVREVRELARRNNVPVGEVLIETKSAKDPGRPVFGSLMRRVNKGEFAGILAWKMDRLARNHFDTGVVLQALAERKIQSIITSDGVKTDSGNDRLMGSIELAMATHFIDGLRANTKRGLREKLKQGWAPGVPPPGYVNDVVHKTIKSDRKRLPMIRRIFELFLSGAMRPEQLRVLANTEWGFRTVKRKHSGGKPMGRTMIYEILANPFYAGFIPRGGELIPGRHEAIITWQEFEEVQAKLGRHGRPRPKSHDFAFAGLLTCGRCGASLTPEQHIKRSGRRYAYYRCNRTRSSGQQCREAAIPESLLIEQVAKVLGRLSIPERVLEWLKGKVAGVLEADHARGVLAKKTLEEALRSTERQIANLLDLRLKDSVSQEIYTTKSHELEQQRVSLAERLAANAEAGEQVGSQVTELLDFAATVRQRFLEGSPVQQRVILEAVASNFTVRARKVAFQMEKPLDLVADAGGCSSWLRGSDSNRRPIG